MSEDKTKYQFNTIKDLMQLFLQKNKLESGMQQIDVRHAWREVMGEGVWNYTTQVKLTKGNLSISLRSSTIREELSYRKEDIVEMLNQYLKTNLIKKIRLM